MFAKILLVLFSMTIFGVLPFSKGEPEELTITELHQMISNQFQILERQSKILDEQSKVLEDQSKTLKELTIENEKQNKVSICML